MTSLFLKNIYLVLAVLSLHCCPGFSLAACGLLIAVAAPVVEYSL